MKWDIIVAQIIGVMIETLVVYHFFNTTLSEYRQQGKINTTVYIITAVILSAIDILIENQVIIFMALIVTVLIISSLYIGEWKNKFILSVMLTVIFVLSEIGVGMLLSMISSNSIEVISNNTMLYFQGVFASKMLAFVIVKCVGFYKNRYYLSLSPITCIGLLTMPVTSIIVIASITEIVYTCENYRNILLVLLIAICLIFANAFAFYLFEHQLKTEESKIRYKFMEIYLSKQKECYSLLAERQEEVNKAAHDMKNALISILGYMTNSNGQKAQEKIQELLNITRNELQKIYTGNIVMDTMINTKLKRINDLEIDFKVIAKLDNIDFDEIGFGIILGNALDNAIEACEKIKDSKKRNIVLRINMTEDSISCYMQNSVNDNDEFYIPKTTKEDKIHHGFGMENIRTIISKNGGNIVCKKEGNKFVLSIMFQI